MELSCLAPRSGAAAHRSVMCATVEEMEIAHEPARGDGRVGKLIVVDKQRLPPIKEVLIACPRIGACCLRIARGCWVLGHGRFKVERAFCDRPSLSNGCGSDPEQRAGDPDGAAHVS